MRVPDCCFQEADMRFDDQNTDGAYARRVLERAQVRAMARRQLSLSIPIVAIGAFVVGVLSFNAGHAAPPQSYDQRAPISAPASRHFTMLCAVPGATDA
jgi:hypothetical protein